MRTETRAAAETRTGTGTGTGTKTGTGARTGTAAETGAEIEMGGGGAGVVWNPPHQDRSRVRSGAPHAASYWRHVVALVGSEQLRPQDPALL